MEGKRGMNCFVAILFAIIGARWQSVLSAPVSPQNALTFYDKLYQNKSEKTCALLPKVSQLDSNYTRSMINQLCDSNWSEGNVTPTKHGVGVCNSLADLFPKICNSYNNSSAANTVTNITVDLKALDTLGVAKVCLIIEEIIGNISLREKVASPFTSASDAAPGREELNESCSSVCQNSYKIREGSIEYSKLRLHPACLILLKGYKVYSMELSAVLPISSVSSIVTKRVESKDKDQTDLASTTDTGTGVESKPTSNPAPAVVDVQNTNIQPPINSDEEEIKATPATVNLRKEITSAHVDMTENSAAQSKKSQNISKSSTTVVKPISQTEPQTSKVTNPPVEVGKQENHIGSSGKASSTSTTSTTTTTTVASVEVPSDEAMPVVNSVDKLKSSTAVPRENDDTAFAEVSKQKNKDTKIPPVEEKESDKDTSVKGKQPPKPSKSAKENEEIDNIMSDIDADAGDYNAGEDMTNDNDIKPPKLTEEDKEVEIPQPETQNMGYESDNSINRPSKNRVSGNEFNEQFDFSRDTTINVSLKESEDTGFFSYFLFCVTIVGVVYLVIHNKKKLIAYVVEGKRPRSRSRRSSSSGSGQYRRLENNYD